MVPSGYIQTSTGGYGQGRIFFLSFIVLIKLAGYTWKMKGIMIIRKESGWINYQVKSKNSYTLQFF